MAVPFGPLFTAVAATTLNEIIGGYVYQNSYVGTPFQRYFRASGAYDPFGGGAGMKVPQLYQGAPGGAGVNYALSPTFGQAIAAGGYQLPRTFRVSVGVRF